MNKGRGRHIALLILLLCGSGMAMLSATPRKIPPKKNTTVKRSVAKPAPKANVAKKNQAKVAAKATTKSTLAKTAAKPSAAQQQIAARQKELLALQKSIAGDRKKIEVLASKETATTQAIAAYQKHGENIQRYISLLEEEITSLQDKAEDARREGNEVSQDLVRLRQQYGVLIRSLAVKNTPSVPEMLMTPSQQNDVVVEETIRRLTSEVSHASRRLSTKRDSLAIQTNTLVTKSDMRASLLAMKNNEQQALDRIIATRQKALEKIRSDKKELLLQIKKNEQSAQAVNRLIDGMVAKEERSAKTTGAKTTAVKGAGTTSKAGAAMKNAPVSLTSTQKPSAGAIKPGSLPYPVGSRKILHGFGTYRNPVTNTQTNNPGIDIAAPRGSGVSAVAGGVVSLVHWLPGYGSLVIVDHRNGFRTVYANLASVSVKQGQNLNAGQNVGKSGESVDGEFLHLELWHERQRLNPAAYLK